MPLPLSNPLVDAVNSMAHTIAAIELALTNGSKDPKLVDIRHVLHAMRGINTRLHNGLEHEGYTITISETGEFYQLTKNS